MLCLKGEYVRENVATRKTKLGARGQGDKEVRGEAYGERGVLCALPRWSLMLPCVGGFGV